MFSRSHFGLPATLVSTLMMLAACDRKAQTVEPPGPDAEIAWTRAALERNPQIEVVASDPQTGLFTIRNKISGEVSVVASADIAAAPVAQLAVATVAAAPVAAAVVSEPATAPVAAPEIIPATPAASATAQVTPDALAATPTQSSSESSYTIERADGQVRVSGPGVSIVSSSNPAAAGAANEAGQRTVEPIICEGRRMMHFDNRSIYVDGDAITVRGGCELFITNSRVVASGTGVIVRDATVHVSNSHIEGAQRSFEADGGSKMFVRGSTFQGLSDRDGLASVQDQGGNRWR